MAVSHSMIRINNRIPGMLPPPPKTEIDGKVTNLQSKTVQELIELKERQRKLLNNHPFISKLADKGAKIQAFHDKIVKELKSRQDEDQACQMFDKLNLNAVQHVEWEGKLKIRETYLDSDDESDPEDVLQILSQRMENEKQIKHVQPEKPSITPQDLANIGEIPYIKHIADKTENKSQIKPTGQFKPYKTTKSDVHNPEKEIQRKKHKHWEVTAATPPPIIHGPAKVLSLEESLNLQKDYNRHLKEVEAKHAAEKLLARVGVKMEELPSNTSKFGQYREAESDSDDTVHEGSEDEVHDEEPERGGVVFPVMK